MQVQCTITSEMLNVTTKTGDAGETSLANGKRLSKADATFAVIGTLDELNSHLGVVNSLFLKLNSELKKTKEKKTLSDQQYLIKQIQKQLFVLGGYVAKANIKLSLEFLENLEQNSILLQEKMAADWHNRFVLPGGHILAAHLDVARSVCRRLERECVIYQIDNKVDELLLKTINRLSDYLYVLRCFINEELGVEEHYV